MLQPSHFYHFLREYAFVILYGMGTKPQDKALSTQMKFIKECELCRAD